MEGFQYGDIIVIGAIAAFIILRYRAMLGSETGRDPSEIKKPQPLEEYERVVKIAEKPAAQISVMPDPDANFSELLAITFKNIRNYDPEFTPQEFLSGAKIAFEMIIKAFNERDHETLKMLLAKDVYENFKEVIEGQVSQNVKQETTLVAIKNADITKAQLNGKIARLTVKFESDQIHLMRDASGAITQGNPSDIDLMDDEWVFERDVSSSSPNWMVVET